MLLFKKSKRASRAATVFIYALLTMYTISSVTSVYVPQVIVQLNTDDESDISSKDTFLREGHSAAFPYGIKEEGSGVSPAIKLPNFLKAILPPPCTPVKLNGESQYNNTRQRIVPVVWNPTIPIALRKLTI